MFFSMTLILRIHRTSMAPLLITTFSLFLILLVDVGHAATTPEEYWHAVLPNTPIPNVIRDILNTGEKQNFHVDNGGYRELFFDNSNYGGGPRASSSGGEQQNFHVEDGEYRELFFDNNINYGPPRASSSGEDIVHYDPSINYYFKEEDLLRPGAKMNFPFPKSDYGITFLSRQDAQSIPFSSSRLPEIFTRFSIAPKSALAKYVINTLAKCELPDAYGETKLCATSLESMVDFTTSSLGTNQVQALSTVVISKEDKKEPVLFSIAGTRRLHGDKLVACHEQAYPYAVFYCHAFAARGYVAQLVGEDGMKVESVVTCHTETKGWNPDHMAFKILKVKPGQATICHFLPQIDLIFSRSI